MASLDEVNSLGLTAIVAMAVVGWITQLARVFDIVCIKFKLVGANYRGQAASRMSLFVWHLIDIVTASLILAGSQFLLHVWVCSFVGFFIADSLELAYFWDVHPKSFKYFMVKHHLMGSLVSIMWAICRIFYTFPPFGVATAILWHSSALITEIPLLYKAYSTRDGSEFSAFETFHKLMKVVFVLQRLWRCAVIITIIASGFPREHTEVFFIGIVPAILLDGVDIHYQWKSVRKPIPKSIPNPNKTEKCIEVLPTPSSGAIQNDDVPVQLVSL